MKQKSGSDKWKAHNRVGGMRLLGIKVVKPKDRMPDEILGVITPATNESDYVQSLEQYYGFSCAVFDA